MFGVFYPGHPYPGQAVWLIDQGSPAVGGETGSETITGTYVIAAAIEGTAATSRTVTGTAVTSATLTGTVES
jgi:hypothetical protein